MPTGGRRVGAGRKPTGKPTTKANIYVADRKLINGYALSLGIPVNELMHRVFTHSDFEQYFRKINNIQEDEV